MASIEALFADYAQYHRTPGNKFFHRLGIPMIVLSLFGMLARVSLWTASTSLDIGNWSYVWRIDAAILLIIAAEIFYFTIEWRLAFLMLVASTILYGLGAAIPMSVNVVLFVVGWIFQGIGHTVYEKRQPAFLRNFVHLLVGPLWILNDAIPVVKKDSVRVSA